MIFGIGTDIVRVARMAQDLERYGERFAERILDDRELTEFRQTARPAHFLAKRFAAKEAASKALGTGFSDGLFMRHIAVTHDSRGRPMLAFSGRAAEMAVELGIGDMHLSLSDEEEFAIAFVTLLRR